MSRHRARKGLRRNQAAQGGAVTVEFALVIPLAILFLGFVLALGLRALWGGLAEDAARSLVRYASIRNAAGTYPTRPEIVTRSGTVLGGVLGTPTLTLLEVVRASNGSDNVQTGQFATDDVNAAPTEGSGDLLKVIVTYRVPGVSILTDLVRNLPGVGFDMTGLSTVTETSSARRE